MFHCASEGGHHTRQDRTSYAQLSVDLRFVVCVILDVPAEGLVVAEVDEDISVRQSFIGLRPPFHILTDDQPSIKIKLLQRLPLLEARVQHDWVRDGLDLDEPQLAVGVRALSKLFGIGGSRASGSLPERCTLNTP